MPGLLAIGEKRFNWKCFVLSFGMWLSIAGHSSYVWRKQKQQVTEVASCPPLWPRKHFRAWPLFPDQQVSLQLCAKHLDFTRDCTHGGTVHRMGGMKRSLAWPSDVFVWYFPRKPTKDSSPSRWWKCGSSMRGPTAGASDGFPPQLLLRQHSLSHSSASLCRVCLYAHLLSEGAACWQILDDVSIFIFVFQHGRLKMFINNFLLQWVAVVIYSQYCVWHNGIWKSVFSVGLMGAGVSTLSEWSEHLTFMFLLFLFCWLWVEPFVSFFVHFNMKLNQILISL